MRRAAIAPCNALSCDNKAGIRPGGTVATRAGSSTSAARSTESATWSTAIAVLAMQADLDPRAQDEAPNPVHARTRPDTRWTRVNFAEAIQGPWLMEQMQAQAAHLGTNLVQDTIVSVDLARRPKAGHP